MHHDRYDFLNLHTYIYTRLYKYWLWFHPLTDPYQRPIDMTFKHKHIKIIRQDAVLSAYRLSSCMQYKKFPNSSLLFKLHHSILISLPVPLNSITTGQGNRHGCDTLFSYWAVKCISPSYVQHGNKQYKSVLCDLFVWPRDQVWYFWFIWLFIWRINLCLWLLWWSLNFFFSLLISIEWRLSSYIVLSLNQSYHFSLVFQNIWIWSGLLWSWFTLPFFSLNLVSTGCSMKTHLVPLMDWWRPRCLVLTPSLAENWIWFFFDKYDRVISLYRERDAGISFGISVWRSVFWIPALGIFILIWRYESIPWGILDYGFHLVPDLKEAI